MKRQSTFSVNGAADVLERDRRTVQRALRTVSPDEEKNGHPRWRLRTIIDAFAAHESRHTETLHDRDTVTTNNAELLSLAHEVQADFEAMRAERSIERRRELAHKVVGPKIGRLIDLLEVSHLAFQPESRPFIKQSTDRIVGDTVAYLLELCEWELKLEQ